MYQKIKVCSLTVKYPADDWVASLSVEHFPDKKEALGSIPRRPTIWREERWFPAEQDLASQDDSIRTHQKN